MKKVSFEEMRAIQLSLLQEIDRLARANEIEYTLVGGSLIGAMRHQGFIPWDDDIDIGLTRTNYEKLMLVLREQKDYGLYHHSVEESYEPMARIYDKHTFHKGGAFFGWKDKGIFIDIFPYDLLPEREEEQEPFFEDVHKMVRNLKCSVSFPKQLTSANYFYSMALLVKDFPKIIKYHGKSKKMADETDALMRKYEKSGSDYIGFTHSHYGLRERFPKVIFEHYEDINFENLTVRKIKEHDTYLKQLFGDYMQLPPENQRETHSYYHWYWKEEEKK